MIVGIITGTYSSVFIAAAIVSFWRGGAPTRATQQVPATALTAPATPKRPG
jgi:preprotein translocase subunit SecF